MKTLKYIIIVGLCLLCAGLNAKDLTGVRIYINPGHGGFDAANDRNVVTIPYEPMIQNASGNLPVI